MTTYINQELAIPSRASAPPTVAVIAERDIFDQALLALVISMGFIPLLIDLDDTDLLLERPAIPPLIAVIRSTEKIGRLRSDSWFRHTGIAGLDIEVAENEGTTICSSAGAAYDLTQFIGAKSGGLSPASAPVNLTAREIEILTTYTLGATLRETSRRHYVAESTVRAHYRRVRQRYGEAGLPICNKSQMLLRLLADGWVQQHQLRQGTQTTPTGRNR